jgi:hypothetical protein
MRAIRRERRPGPLQRRRAERAHELKLGAT